MNSVVPPEKQGSSRIYHVTADDFVPSLLEPEIDQIDNMLAQSDKEVPKEVRQHVLGKKEDRPDMTTMWLGGKEKNARQCAHCEKVGKQTMPQCSRCKLVRYCDAKWCVPSPFERLFCG